MDGLDDSQAEKLRQFQEFTNCQDIEMALGTLASLDWDLSKAIEMQMVSPMEIDDGDLSNIFGDSSTTNSHHENGYPAGCNNDIFTSGGSTSGGEEDVDVAGSSTHHKGTRKAAIPKPNGLKKCNLSSNKTVGPSSSLPVGPRTRSYAAAAKTTSSGVGHLEMSSDDDNEDYDYHGFVNDDIDEPPSRANGDAVPLVPTDFSSVTEAINNFNTVFESRYSALHPAFYLGELRQAAREAFDAPNRPVAERRPLVVYLHHDKSVACHIFAKDVLCADAVAALLRRQFVLWAWDVTQRENKQKFFEWAEQIGVRDVRQTVDRMLIDRFPLLIIFVKDKGIIQVYDYATGVDSVNAVVDKLMAGLDNYQQIKSSDSIMERERLEREQIRQEQAREYEESLAADRARAERLEKERRMQMEEEAARLHAMEMKLQKEAKLAASLPMEPPANEKEITVIRIRFPRNPDDGTQKVELRRFRMSEPLKNLATFVESKGYNLDEYRIWTSDFPKKDMVASFDLDRSFKDLKWPVREQVIVDEKL